MATRIIAFLSQSPASCKTIACIYLAAALAEMGKPVLVIDLDPKLQAFLLLWRAYAAATPPDSGDAAIFLDGAFHPPPVPRLLIGSPFASRPPAEDGHDWPDVEANFAAFLANTSRFAFVLVDTASSDERTQVLALSKCNEAIIPVRPTAADCYACVPTMQGIVQARERRRDGQPDLLAFLPIATSPQREMRAVRALLGQHNLAWLTPIRRCRRLKRPMRPGAQEDRVLTLVCPEHGATADFRQVAREIVMGIGPARELAGLLARPPSGVTPRTRRIKPNR
jgi:cellulose biosynthesis protein BcsQ